MAQGTSKGQARWRAWWLPGGRCVLSTRRPGPPPGWLVGAGPAAQVPSDTRRLKIFQIAGVLCPRWPFGSDESFELAPRQAPPDQRRPSAIAPSAYSPTRSKPECWVASRYAGLRSVLSEGCDPFIFVRGGESWKPAAGPAFSAISSPASTLFGVPLPVCRSRPGRPDPVAGSAPGHILSFASSWTQ